MNLFISFNYVCRLDKKTYSGFGNTILEVDEIINDNYGTNLLTNKVEEVMKDEMKVDSIKIVILYFKEL